MTRNFLLNAAIFAGVAVNTFFARAEGGAELPSHDEKITGWRNEQNRLMETIDGINATVDQEGRDPTQEEQETIDQSLERFDQLEGFVTQRAATVERQARAMEPEARTTDPEPVDDDRHARGTERRASTYVGGGNSYGGRNARVEPAREVPGMGPFKSAAHYFDEVRRAAGGNGSQVLAASQRRWASAQNMGVGEEGGFIAPPAIANGIMEKVTGSENFLSRCDTRYTDSDTYRMHINPHEPWKTDGGVQAHWTGESEKIKESIANLQRINVDVHKLAAIVPVTMEQMRSVPEMERMIRSEVPKVITERALKAVLVGTGAKQPLGILTHTKALAVAAKEDSQTAATITYDNVIEIEDLLHASCLPNAINIANQDVKKQLRKLKDADNRPLFLRENNLASRPFDTLNGAPIVYSPHSPALGDPGDLLFVDLSHYVVVLSRDAARSDYSMHVRFMEDEGVFRFVFPMGGQPKWEAAITEPNSTTKRSYAAVIAQRS